MRGRPIKRTLRDGGEDPVPETQSEFIMREQARKSP